MPVSGPMLCEKLLNSMQSFIRTTQMDLEHHFKRVEAGCGIFVKGME